MPQQKCNNLMKISSDNLCLTLNLYSIILFTIFSMELLLISIFVCYNLLRKNEKLEDTVIIYSDYIEKISNVINESNKKLDEVDEKGSFRSDDEVGFFFNNLKEIQKVLNEFKTK